MRYNLGLSVLAGSIIGALLGAIFYIVPAKFLICGPIPATHIMLPDGVQSFILAQTLQWGAVPGLIIGLLGGLNNNASMPRGLLSCSIGVWCFLFGTIAAWATQWGFLADTSGGRIAITVVVTIMMFLLCIPISRTVSFIEAIRE